MTVPSEADILDIDEDYDTYVVTKGQGYVIAEAYDHLRDERWWTLIIELGARPSKLKEAFDWFTDGVEVLESFNDDDCLYIDLGVRR